MLGVLEVLLPRDPIPRQSLVAGAIQIALTASLGVLRAPGLGAGKPGRSSSPGLGCSRHCVGHAFAISAQLCRRWMTLRSVVHIGPDAARATIELRWVYDEVGRGARSKTESWPNGS